MGKERKDYRGYGEEGNTVQDASLAAEFKSSAKEDGECNLSDISTISLS
jgi:hypothetical protein